MAARFPISVSGGALLNRIAIADPNKDNLDDTLVALVENLDYDNEGVRIFILINNGNGGFIESSSALINDPVPTDNGGVRQLFLEDFNGDNQTGIWDKGALLGGLSCTG